MIDLDHIRFKGYAFQIEMKFTAYKCGFKIIEVLLFLRSIRSTRSPTVTKSRYGRFSAALFTVSGTSIPDIPPQVAVTRIDQQHVRPLLVILAHHVVGEERLTRPARYNIT